MQSFISYRHREWQRGRKENIENNLPDGLEYFTLKGHFFDMIGIKTSDNVYFLADSLFMM